jgi:hypothetical protein
VQWTENWTEDDLWLRLPSSCLQVWEVECQVGLGFSLCSAPCQLWTSALAPTSMYTHSLTQLVLVGPGI